MARVMSVQDSVVIEGVSPRDVYDQVSDPSRMGRWSPENLGAEVPEHGGAAYVGMSFVGANKRGRIRWSTRCTVTAADRGERFAFRVHAIGLKVPRIPGAIATWEYRFEEVARGTQVTEVWCDSRRGWPDAVANRFDKAATGGRTFADFQRRNIARTLARLKSDLEDAATAAG